MSRNDNPYTSEMRAHVEARLAALRPGDVTGAVPR
jgi:hypothetical protein